MQDLTDEKLYALLTTTKAEKLEIIAKRLKIAVVPYRRLNRKEDLVDALWFSTENEFSRDRLVELLATRQEKHVKPVPQQKKRVARKISRRRKKHRSVKSVRKKHTVKKSHGKKQRTKKKKHAVSKKTWKKIEKKSRITKKHSSKPSKAKATAPAVKKHPRKRAPRHR